jgi:phospholipid/cholesterol/gamma-HCH transport system substrate-binding protein
MAKNRLAAVGAFIVAGLLLFAVGLFLIGDRRLLFTDTFRVYAEFKEVASLDTGAKVRVSGIDAGEVEEIRVPASPSGRFRVRMRVRSDLHPLIREDSIAAIQNDGLVGNKFVQIQTGSEGSPQVKDEGTIAGREPFDVADLMQSMSDTIVTVNKMLADVKGNVDEALHVLSTTANEAQALMKELGTDIRTILASAQRVSADLTAIVGNVRQGRGTVGRLLYDDALFASLKSVAADVEKAMATVREASEDARAAIADLRGDKGPVKGLTGDVQHTLQSARDAMADLAETTEALKRNFLFRGFFNRRGYFDLDDVTVTEYRQGALRSKDRTVLRLWLATEMIFERDANGAERLSDDGKIRLDSAMSQFLRYPQKSPFVIEGYAQEETGDLRYLISHSRAQLVRDYLVGKFKLDPNYVALMAMGSDPKDGPSENGWNGIGLALFVATAAL